MIEILCEYNKIIELEKIKYLNYFQQLSTECWFCIKVDHKVFYEQSQFPLLEFLFFYANWNNNGKHDFIYNTLESDANPMISFTRKHGKWILESPWKLFNCKTNFTINHFVNAVNKMIDINNSKSTLTEKNRM
jgi:hypothetical protein